MAKLDSAVNKNKNETHFLFYAVELFHRLVAYHAFMRPSSFRRNFIFRFCFGFSSIELYFCERRIFLIFFINKSIHFG